MINATQRLFDGSTTGMRAFMRASTRASSATSNRPRQNSIMAAKHCLGFWSHH
jgi:hypothetical protein